MVWDDSRTEYDLKESISTKVFFENDKITFTNDNLEITEIIK